MDKPTDKAGLTSTRILEALSQPVPHMDELRKLKQGYSDLPIDTSHVLFHEPVVALGDYHIAGQAYYSRKNSATEEPVPGVSPTLFLRKTVVETLVKINHALQHPVISDFFGYEVELYVEDALRPVSLQRQLHDELIPALLRRNHPGITDQQVSARLKDIIAVPSADPNKPSPHATGGALDVTLRRKQPGLGYSALGSVLMGHTSGDTSITFALWVYRSYNAIMNDPTQPLWLGDACAHAVKYLTLFVNNPGVEKIVKEFDPAYLEIKDPDARLDYLLELASKEWDFRKGRERYEITETFDIDDPASVKGKIVHDGAKQAEMASASTATLRHYNIMAILGGAYMSPYYRLKYALEQNVTYDMLVFLGSEREVLKPEQEQTKAYAPGAQTEFDLGIGAIITLLRDEIIGGPEYEIVSPGARVAHIKRKDNIPMMVMSAPCIQGTTRANTADTYDFLRKYHGVSLDQTKNILFATGALYRYAQYFDAVREIPLNTGTDVEVIGFDPNYNDTEFKPSQFLQELKSAASAAVRLRDTIRKLQATPDL